MLAMGSNISCALGLWMGYCQGPFVSLASMSSLSPQSGNGQDDDDNKSTLGAPPSNNNRNNLYIHDTMKNIQRSNHESSQLEDDSALEVELGNEKVRRA
jgi:hypothetical protein